MRNKKNALYLVINIKRLRIRIYDLRFTSYDLLADLKFIQEANRKSKIVTRKYGYCIKNLKLPIFLSAVPVPRTTARNGSSAT